jgi:arsenate reductase
MAELMHTTLYGIPNCDTVKKARVWLDTHGVNYRFHDFKKTGLDQTTIDQWLQKLDWTMLVNRKGLTWRGLDEASKASVVDAASASAVMLRSTSVIKRPVLVSEGGTLVGFNPDSYQQIFQPR